MFKEKLGLDLYQITCDKQDTIGALQVAFEGEIKHTQYCIENKIHDACLSKYNIAREIDEYDHECRDSKHGKIRQVMIESYRITIVFRTNPDAADFTINRLINQIYMHIIKPTKKQTEKSTKKSLTNDLSKRLLELEFKSNHSIKSK